jgi:hypothetical protein
VLETDSAGSFGLMARDANWKGKPMLMDGKTFTGGIAVTIWDEPCWAEFDLTDGNWQRLRATLGLEVDTQKLTPDELKSIGIRFVIRGDGKELFSSEPFRSDSPTRELDVPVAGIKILRLEIKPNGPGRDNKVESVNWADLRLEKTGD